MQFPELVRAFEPLWDDLKPENQFYNRKPLLAHYTTLSVLEQILRNNELWFSNPLYMNDLEEVRFGIVRGLTIVRESTNLKQALETDNRYTAFLKALNDEFVKFETQHLFDTYVLCFSEHDIANTDGVLSQWRAYGGNGNGAALVVDTAKLGGEANDRPLILAKVHYGSVMDRLEWLQRMTDKAAAIISEADIPFDLVQSIAWLIFERVMLFALFTKHDGFSEEREWRAVYLRGRDPNHTFDFAFHYHNGARGIEPKLKFPIKPIPGFNSDDLSLEKLTAGILLGPTTSSPLALASVRRMLIATGHPELQSRVVVSSIPLRP